MLRRLAFIGLAALSVTACKKSNPVVAEGKGFTITAADYKARFQEQNPFMRARASSPEHKKEFLDSLVRFEVLAREAERQGFRDDPEVVQKLKLAMIQKLLKTQYGDGSAAAVPDADVQKYYDEHAAEFHKPKRVRASIVLFQAPAGSPDRAKKLAAARKALTGLEAAAKERKDVEAFRKLVAESSDDASSKPRGGDIGLKTAAELEQAYGKELATALFGMKQNELSSVVETPQGYVIARVSMVQEEMNQALEQARPQIMQRLSREMKAKEFDTWVKKLEASAQVKVDEKALAAVDLGPTAGAPAMSSPVQPEGAPPAAPPTPAKPGGDAPPASK